MIRSPSDDRADPGGDRFVYTYRGKDPELDAAHILPNRDERGNPERYEVRPVLAERLPS